MAATPARLKALALLAADIGPADAVNDADDTDDTE